MRQKLTHLFFVDDIKVYAGSSKELTEALKIVQDSSKAVGMALGLAKHGVAHMKRAKIMAKGDDILQNEDLVPEITSNKLYHVPRGGAALLTSNRENPKIAGEEIL